MTSDGYHPRPFRQACWKRPSVRFGAIAAGSFIAIFILLQALPSGTNQAHQSLADQATAHLHGDNGNVQQDPSNPIVGYRRLMNAHDNAQAGESLLVAQQQQHNSNGHPVMRPLVEGEHFFADYDVSTVQIKNEPFPVGKKVFFNYIDPAAHPEYAMQYVSNEPRILYIQDFLSHEECDALVEAASSRMHRSLVVPMLNSDHKPLSDVRTSDQTFLDVNVPQVAPIVERILNLTGFKTGSSEAMQVLRYQLNQKYDAHNDYFDPRLYGSQFTNRAVTVFLYLSDVEEGGETQFPRADGKAPTFDYTSCSHGLRVRPRKGQVALFYDMKPWGQLDPFSLHGGCPVKKGVKWGGTLWLRVPTGGEQ